MNCRTLLFRISLACAAMFAAVQVSHAQNAPYKIGVQTSSFDGTTNNVFIQLHSEENDNWTGWIELRTKHNRNEDSTNSAPTYPMPYRGTIDKIRLKVKKKSAFQAGDDWTPLKVVVSSPYSATNHTYAKTIFTLGGKIQDGDNKWKEFTGIVTNRPAISVSPKGEPVITNVYVTKAYIAQNNGTIAQDVGRITETWSDVEAISISRSETNDIGAAITASYTSPESVAGQFGVEATASWNQSISNAREQSTERIKEASIDKSFGVAPRTFVIKRVTYLVPREHTLYIRNDNGKGRFIRTAGGQIGSIAFENIAEVSLKGNTDPAERKSWSHIEKWYLPYLDTGARNVVLAQKASWLRDGLVTNGPAGVDFIPGSDSDKPPTSLTSNSGTTPSGGAIVLPKSSGVPAELESKIKEFRGSGLKIKSVAFTPDGGWSLVAGKNAFFNRGRSAQMAAMHKVMLDLQKAGHEIKCTAITPTGGWTVMYNKNNFHNRGVPDAAHEAMLRLNREGRTLKHVGYSANGGFAILYDKNGVEQKGIPAKAVEQLTRIAKEGHEMKTVSFPNDDRGFSVVYAFNSYFNWAPPTGAHEEMTRLFNARSEVTGIAFGPNNKWLIYTN